MKIHIVTPAPPRSRHGNRITALRWACHLRRLGHQVVVEQCYTEGECDLLVALHARKSMPSIARARRAPGYGRQTLPLIVALTGTDIYGKDCEDPELLQVLEWADRLIGLQPLAAEQVPLALREKVRVIYQSAPQPRDPPPPLADTFEVCVLGHLRSVKDPLRAALAARLLPSASRIGITHVGEALGEEMAPAALEEMSVNPRYRWLGGQPRSEALHILARSRLLVLTSHAEGGANVVTEALAASVPVISSRIAGSVGLLGEHYPGFYPAGDTEALAAVLHRAETDPAFYRSLQTACAARAWIADPARERDAWRSLLCEFF